MIHCSRRFLSNDVEWHHIETDAFGAAHKVDYRYSILGYDISNNRLDMLMALPDNGAYCEPHSHVASTTLLILEGEQHLAERQPDGAFKQIVRKAGDYALCPPDALPHRESGGPNGCTLLLSLHAANGILFNVFDAEFTEPQSVSIEDFVKRWDTR